MEQSASKTLRRALCGLCRGVGPSKITELVGMGCFGVKLKACKIVEITIRECVGIGVNEEKGTLRRALSGKRPVLSHI